MQQLFFNFNQMFASDEAKKNNINNTTSDPVKLNNLMSLNCYWLTPLAYLIKAELKKTLELTGCFRSSGLVAHLKSATKGHPDGCCADLNVPGMTKQQLFDYIRNAVKAGKLPKYDQLILEHNADGDCVHSGYVVGKNRYETMVRTIVNGKYVYKNV